MGGALAQLLVQGTLEGGKKAADARPVLHGKHLCLYVYKYMDLFINTEL